jgi:hypothetical protein
VEEGVGGVIGFKNCVPQLTKTDIIIEAVTDVEDINDKRVKY